MNARLVTWNVGGCRVLGPEIDPATPPSYSKDGIADVCEWIRAKSPDIVCLQEVHKNLVHDQVASIADSCGYKYYVHESYSQSHIDPEYKLGNAIISRWPITDSTRLLFTNPKLKCVIEHYGEVETHDKGAVVSKIALPESTFRVASLHLIPFSFFNLDESSPITKELLAEVQEILLLDDTNPQIIAGDFNLDTGRVTSLMHEVEGISEVTINAPTIPKGKKLDHVLYRELEVVATEIDSSVQTDHYPVLVDFRV